MNTDLWSRFHAFLELLRFPDTRDSLRSDVVLRVFNDSDTVKVQVKLSAYFDDDLNILYKSQGRHIPPLCDQEEWREQLLQMGVSFDDQVPCRRLMTFDLNGEGVPLHLRDDVALPPPIAAEQRYPSRQRRRTSTLYASQEGYAQEHMRSTRRADRIQPRLQPQRPSHSYIEPILEPPAPPAILTDRDICRMYGIHYGNAEELQSKQEILQKGRWIQQFLPELHIALPMLPPSENISTTDTYAQELKLEYALRQFEIELELEFANFREVVIL